jgi:hypothetical protein
MTYRDPGRSPQRPRGVGLASRTDAPLRTGIPRAPTGRDPHVIWRLVRDRPQPGFTIASIETSLNLA